MTLTDRLAEIPTDAPAWVQDAARCVLLDHCNHTSRADVEAIIGPITDEQHARIVGGAEMYVQYVSEVVATEGVRTFARPVMAER